MTSTVSTALRALRSCSSAPDGDAVAAAITGLQGMEATSLISYAHKGNPEGPRFSQRRCDALPEWAVDVRPHLSPDDAAAVYASRCALEGRVYDADAFAAGYEQGSFDESMRQGPPVDVAAAIKESLGVDLSTTSEYCGGMDGGSLYKDVVSVRLTWDGVPF